ncbi:MAG: DNA gyrase inhibitor YacG [Devosia sp.]|jgi:endogenous inhibitor of DNA gyrase (YacG/DUF329 family)|nr:DNA gyrase inhibitor YacG [Devosiaceae bacterium]
MPADNVVPLRPVRPCPICRRPSTQAFFPFCSARCADIDLNRWLSGAYVIPGKSLAEADDLADDEEPARGPAQPD